MEVSTRRSCQNVTFNYTHFSLHAGKLGYSVHYFVEHCTLFWRALYTSRSISGSWVQQSWKMALNPRGFTPTTAWEYSIECDCVAYEHRIQFEFRIYANSSEVLCDGGTEAKSWHILSWRGALQSGNNMVIENWLRLHLSLGQHYYTQFVGKSLFPLSEDLLPILTSPHCCTRPSSTTTLSVLASCAEQRQYRATTWN